MPLALLAHPAAATTQAAAAARAPDAAPAAQPQRVAVPRRRRFHHAAAAAAAPATTAAAAARPSRRELLAGALRFGAAGVSLMASVDDVAEVATLPRSLSSAAATALPQSPRSAGAGTLERSAAREFELHMPLPLKPISPHVQLSDGTPVPALPTHGTPAQVRSACGGKCMHACLAHVAQAYGTSAVARCPSCPCQEEPWPSIRIPDPSLPPASWPSLQAPASAAEDEPDVPSHARRLLVCGLAVNACPFQALLQPSRADAVFMQLADVAADVGADRLLSALPFGALPVGLLLWGAQLWGCLQPAASQAHQPAPVLA